MKIGNIDIADIKLGDSQVSAWFGGVLVWGGGSPTPPGPTPIFPTQDLKLHFDGIDNAGVGSHLSSTMEWANIAPDTSADYKLRRTSGTWEDDSAVFTGQYNECFWLKDANDYDANQLTGSHTYSIGLVYDPATRVNYAGYLGKEGAGADYTYFMCVKNDCGFRFQQNNVNDSVFGVETLLSANQFNTVTWVVDQQETSQGSGVWDTTISVFVNDHELSSFNYTKTNGEQWASSGVLTLGGGVQSSTGTRVCRGKICNFMGWGRALSRDEVTQVHDYSTMRFSN